MAMTYLKYCNKERNVQRRQPYLQIEWQIACTYDIYIYIHNKSWKILLAESSIRIYAELKHIKYLKIYKIDKN